MKSFSIIVIILIAALVGIGFYLKDAFEKLKFKFDLSGINLSQLKSGTINVKAGVTIENKNKFNITFSRLFVRLFYNNQLIAQSKEAREEKIVVPKNSEIKFIEDIEVYVNSATIDLVKNSIAKESVEIKYEIDLIVFGIRIPTIKNSFTY